MKQTEVEAANYDAMNRLRADIAAQRLSPNLSVADFLQRTGGESTLMDTLHHAEQLAGVLFTEREHQD